MDIEKESASILSSVLTELEGKKIKLDNNDDLANQINKFISEFIALTNNDLNISNYDQILSEKYDAYINKQLDTYMDYDNVLEEDKIEYQQRGKRLI